MTAPFRGFVKAGEALQIGSVAVRTFPDGFFAFGRPDSVLQSLC
jgi:hypothetical protein